MIYAICDKGILDELNLDIKDWIEILKRNGVFKNIVFIQYRDKKSKIYRQKRAIKLLKRLTKKIVIINDNFLLLKEADGLHLGQEDLNRLTKNKKKFFKKLKKRYSNKIFGLSTHNLKEIFMANRLKLDYIGLGAFRSTKTKDTKNILGKKIERLAKFSIHPVVAIGGIRLEDKIKNISFRAIGRGLI